MADTPPRRQLSWQELEFDLLWSLVNLRRAAIEPIVSFRP